MSNKVTQSDAKTLSRQCLYKKEKHNYVSDLKFLSPYCSAFLKQQYLIIKTLFLIGCTGCSKSLGHILTMNISETIKDIKTHLVNSESL